ncbi:MAG: extracellular solute-binding protein [Treponema sp.]|nr:extracellular solute-binding protein [Treponema sp.]
MKKLSAALAGLLACASLFTGCAKKEASSGSGSGVKTITIWDFKCGSGASKTAMEQIDALIEKNNPDIKINHVAQPDGDNYYQLVRAAVQAGEGPDIVMFHGGLQAYEFDDYTLPLDKYISSWRSEIAEGNWAFCSENGDGSKPVHMVPLTTQGFGIYTNKKLLKQAGIDPEKIPATKEEFLANCAALKKAGIAPIVGGFSGGPYTVDFLFRCFIANIYGDKVADLAKNVDFAGNAQFKEACEITKELMTKYIDDDASSTVYFTDAGDNFAAGKGAMFIGLLSDVNNWKTFCDALGKDNVGYYPTVNFANASGKDIQVLQPCGIGYSIMKWSKNPDAAAKVLQAYGSGEGPAIFMGVTGALGVNKKADIKSLGYPIVGDILARKSALDVTNILTNEDANSNFDRYCTEAFVSGEISIDEFIAKCQTMLVNARKAR